MLIAGYVTSDSPFKISDGNNEIMVSGITATVRQFVFVTGNWDGSTLTATSTPIIY